MICSQVLDEASHKSAADEWSSFWTDADGIKRMECGCPTEVGCFCGKARSTGMCRCLTDTKPALKECERCSMIWPTKEMVDEAHDAWADALDAEKKLDNHIKKLKKERTEVIKQKQIAKKRHEKMNKKFLEMKQKKDKKKDKEDSSPDNKQDKQDASGGDKKQDKPGASHDDQKRSDAILQRPGPILERPGPLFADKCPA